MKIVYVGIDLLFPALPVLDGLCEIQEIVTCRTDNVTEFNTRVCEYAGSRGIPLKIGRIVQEDLDRFVERGCEALICGGYYHKIPLDPRMYFVNIHPALLPVGRGSWPMPYTILHGITRSGMTVHKMTEEFDAGDILLQEEVPVFPTDDLVSLSARQNEKLPGMMRRLAEEFPALWEHAVPQSEGEFWDTGKESDYPITADTGAEEADRILRAFLGYECVYRGGGAEYGLTGGRFHPGEAPASERAGEEENPAAPGFFKVRGGYITAERIQRLK